jgi:hypothetical protein
MAVQPLIGAYVHPNGLGPYYVTGAPSAGTNEVQTLDIKASTSGGTFKIGFDGKKSAAITWNATNATLLANIQAALDAMPNLGTNWVVAAAGTLTAGIGTITLTFSGGDVAKKAVPLMTVEDNAITGGAIPTIAETTPGVDATVKWAARGAILVRLDGGLLYVNTSATAGSPTWTAQV